MLKQFVLVMTLAGLASGCAESGEPSATAPPAAPPAIVASSVPVPPATEGESVDGLYSGTAITTLDAGGRCSTSGDANFQIRNGVVTRRFGPTTLLEADVQPDGTFSTQAGHTTMVGKVRDGHLEADIGNEYCGFRYVLDRA